MATRIWNESKTKKPPLTALVDLTKHPGAFSTDNGFSYLNWEPILETIQRTVAEPERGFAWHHVMLQWLERLRSDLGGGYVLRVAGRIALLSPVNERHANALFTFGEQALDTIGEQLGEAAWTIGAGQCPIVIFKEDEHYQRYIRHFDPQGFAGRAIADTDGVCLGGGYVHIALPPRILQKSKHMLAHELTHVSTVHLPVPAWLSEGLALHIEKDITGEDAILVGHELISTLRSFWTEKNIQTFWSGESFIVPGGSNQLSYVFAELQFRYLLKNGRDIIGFLKAARYEDAGQTAAINLLDTDLNDAVVEFLGPGEWRPDRPAIIEFWKSAGWEESRPIPF